MTQRLCFGRFELDPEHGSLRSGDREIVVRPESLAVLLHLARNAERPVPDEELVEAGWPGLIVGGDWLADTITELRTALGDDGAKLIVTLPDGGYRFVPAAAAQERRKARGWHPLRWRWIYGILAPLLLAMTVVVLLLWNRGAGTPAPADQRARTTNPEN